MPYFTRRKTPPENTRSDYQGFRPAVREDFRRTCAYCLLEEKWAGGEENYELDHFRPQVLFEELINDFYNLYWACHVCNRTKGMQWPPEKLRGKQVLIVDLCSQEFDDHFVDHPNGQWHGKTQQGKYSIETMRLNRPHLVELRRLLRKLKTP